eukprot:g37082.t1
MGDNTPSATILNTDALQGHILIPLLDSLYTHDRLPKFHLNWIYKFADDTTIVNQISNNDATEYGKETECLVAWCKDNNLSINISKMKKLTIAFRKWSEGHVPVCINGAEVETVESIKVPGVIITNNLSRSIHVDMTIKKTQQCLYFLRRPRKLA